MLAGPDVHAQVRVVDGDLGEEACLRLHPVVKVAAANPAALQIEMKGVVADELIARLGGDRNGWDFIFNGFWLLSVELCNKCVTDAARSLAITGHPLPWRGAPSLPWMPRHRQGLRK